MCSEPLGPDHPEAITTAKTSGVFLFMKGDARGAISALNEASRRARGRSERTTGAGIL